MTADISTSLKVVSMAASCWAATRRCAIFWRKGDIFLRDWRAPVGTVGLGAATGAGAAGAAGAAAGFSPAASMSPLVTRPALPVPATAAGLMPVSSAIRRTAGEELDSLAAAAGAVGEAAGAAAPAEASELMVATSSPILTSVPAATFREILPADSAVPSEVILSVSSSKSG